VQSLDLDEEAFSGGRCVFRTGDLGTDPRWPEFGRRAADLGVHSMLSFRLFLEDDDLIARLNLYATARDAFDGTAEIIGTLLASHGALAVSAAGARELAAHLRRALTTNREIGVAMGGSGGRAPGAVRR